MKIVNVVVCMCNVYDCECECKCGCARGLIIRGVSEGLV